MTPIHLRSQWWAVPIDKDAINIKLHRPLNKYWHVNWEYPGGHQYSSSGFAIWYKTFGGKKNYPDDLQILCTLKEYTEEISKKIVGSSEWYFPEKHTRYIDYAFPFDMENKQRWSEGFATAIESFHSLIRSKGLDTEKNYIILEKK